ncbi:MAG: Leucine-, isoleucine-, valine-, threonine-, and alanine-binding protein [Anaerolineae bacterium]|nr:Leucine-, isoleucine-, valine-, threonine-, and alanine-binding protein [Anaerolineae bacterium]
MKRFAIFMLFAVILALVAACGGAAAPQSAAPASSSSGTQAEVAKEEPAAAAPAAKTVVIGYTSSKTGAQEVPSSGQTHGLELWLEQVNKDGVKLADGSVVKFEAKTYDDESASERVQSLYTTLIEEDKADYLISPYSSGLTDAAAVVGESYGKVMITTGAASDGTYKKGLTNVFQLYTPASRYLTGAIDLLAATDPSAKKIAFIHETDKFSTDVVDNAKTYAEGKGYEVVLFEGYDSGTTDFAPFINKISAAAPDAVMGGGHFNDGSTFARQIAEKGVNMKMLALLVAPPEPKFAELGDAALGVVGPSQWEPQANYSADAAKAAGIEWYGPSVKEFVEAYKAKYGEDPSYHAAGGYASGLVLQRAIEQAGSVEQEAVKAALDATNILTFYGNVKFDTSAEAHGLQQAHQMVYVQWQKDDAGNLVKQVVWPKEGRSAEPLYPLAR